ncbi:hypothetical protein Dimus_003187, partial [Dionaea muscipula]
TSTWGCCPIRMDDVKPQSSSPPSSVSNDGFTATPVANGRVEPVSLGLAMSDSVQAGREDITHDPLLTRS